MSGITSFNRLAKPGLGWLLALSLWAGAPPPEVKPSEVIIVGTVHEATKQYTVQDLVGILKRVRPDVILCESDASFFTDDFKFIKNFGGQEQSAIIEYLKTEQALLRPYDIEGRNEFYRKNDTFNQENAFFRKLSELDKGRKLNEEARKMLGIVRECFQKRDEFGKADPRRINSFDCDRVLAQKWYAMDVGHLEIIRLTPELQAFREFHISSRSFELQRNNAMVENILRYTRTFPGKRLLVVCGFEHRHFLRLSLSFSASPTFILKEYWEY